jgi:hypothetical protein
MRVDSLLTGLATLLIALIVILILLRVARAVGAAAAAAAATDGFASGSETILNGWLVYVYDSSKPATRETNVVAKLLEETSTPTQLENVRLYRLDTEHTLPLGWLDMADEKNAELAQFFMTGMGLYINGGGSTGLYLNNNFSADHIGDRADADKLLRIFFHAPSQRDLADRVADEFGLYLEERDDVAMMESTLWKLYSE